MTPDQFAEKVKNKYPDYASIDNNELAKRIVDKHPEYASQVDFSSQSQKPSDMQDRIIGGIRSAANLINPVMQFSPQNIKSSALGAERALLTNDRTQNWQESMIRGTPAAVGGALGGTIGVVAGAPLTAGALATSMGGAVLGGSAFEAARQGAAQMYSGITGRGDVVPASYAVKQTAIQGLLQAPAQAVNLGIGLLAKYVPQQLPAALKNFVGIQEPVTKYVQERGSNAIFTPENLNAGSPLDNIAQATSDLSNARSSVGANIGNAEDAVLSKIGDNAPSVRHIREGLQNELYSRGITDPRTAGLARSKESGILTKLVDALTPDVTQNTSLELGSAAPQVTEKMTLRQALNAKRLIDQQLEFSGKELSTPTEQLLKKVNNQLRESVRADMGSEVSKLWDHFGEIADAQDKLAEFTGTRALSNVQQRAVQSLRGIMIKNPNEVNNIVDILSKGLPGGVQQARTIFDSIAAEPFVRGGHGAPSSTFLKVLTAGGLLSGPAARGAVRASESIGNMGTNAIIPRTIGPVLSTLSDAYGRLRNH